MEALPVCKARLVAESFSQKFRTDYDILFTVVRKRVTFLLSKAQVRKAKRNDIKQCFIKELVKDGAVITKHCQTSQMVADVLKKPLEKIELAAFREDMNVEPLQN